MARTYRRYDPRLKNLVAASDDFSRFRSLGIPISTLRQWQGNGRQEFLSLPELEFGNEQVWRAINGCSPTIRPLLFA